MSFVSTTNQETKLRCWKVPFCQDSWSWTMFPSGRTPSGSWRWRVGWLATSSSLFQCPDLGLSYGVWHWRESLQAIGDQEEQHQGRQGTQQTPTSSNSLQVVRSVQCRHKINHLVHLVQDTVCCPVSSHLEALPVKSPLFTTNLMATVEELYSRVTGGEQET